MLRRLLESLHLAAVSLWLGALVLAGATAAIAFPTMSRLDPRLPEFAAYPGPHHRIAAGQVMQRVFLVTDLVQVGAVFVAGVALSVLILRGHVALTRPMTVVRAALLLGVLGLLGYKLFVLDPRMSLSLRAFWSAAAEGRLEDAEAARRAFDADHPRASAVLSVLAGGVLALIVCGIRALATGAEERRQ